MRWIFFCLVSLGLVGSAAAEITFRPEAEGQALARELMERIPPEKRAQMPWLKDPGPGKRLRDGEVRDVPFSFPTLSERLAQFDAVDPLHTQLFDDTVHSTHSPSRALIETKTPCLWKKSKAVGPDADGTGRTYTVTTIYDCGQAYLMTVEGDYRNMQGKGIIYNDALYNDPVGNRFLTHQQGLRHDGQVQTTLLWLNARYKITYALYHPDTTDFDIPALRAVLVATAHQQYAEMEAQAAQATDK
ncbi:hypothetical protein [Asticcacaulis sp.]|uniref:hypothetical protein n=1 Tax=Asticcacaulis sp. TaxID=1872648 RepID=UPI002618F42F|nr:hypothetical protein [Asticcacaulis sp.]